MVRGFSDGTAIKNLPANAGDTDKISIPGLGRPTRVANGNPLQYACVEDPIDRGPWRPAVHGVPKSWAQLCD